MLDDLNDNWYFCIGNCIGGLMALVAFCGSWWYCASTYGYLFGFGLGWLPSAILAAIVGLVAKVLWGPLIIMVMMILIEALG